MVRWANDVRYILTKGLGLKCPCAVLDGKIVAFLSDNWPVHLTKAMNPTSYASDWVRDLNSGVNPTRS